MIQLTQYLGGFNPHNPQWRLLWIDPEEISEISVSHIAREGERGWLWFGCIGSLIMKSGNEYDIVLADVVDDSGRDWDELESYDEIGYENEARDNGEQFVHYIIGKRKDEAVKEIRSRKETTEEQGDDND